MGRLGQAVGLWAARGCTTKTISVGDQTSTGVVVGRCHCCDTRALAPSQRVVIGAEYSGC